jgi:hypothetical protein
MSGNGNDTVTGSSAGMTSAIGNVGWKTAGSVVGSRFGPDPAVAA